MSRGVCAPAPLDPLMKVDWIENVISSNTILCNTVTPVENSTGDILAHNLIPVMAVSQKDLMVCPD